VIYAIFTKVCRVFLPFFAVIFYCPYSRVHKNQFLAEPMGSVSNQNLKNDRKTLTIGYS